MLFWTGLVVKCHQTRSLDQNRKIARKTLLVKLDNELNKDMSIESQIKRLTEKRNLKNENKSKKLKELKKQWKEREGLL